MRKLHRSFFVLKMSTHVNMLSEAFDKPYRFRKKELFKGYIVYKFTPDDGSDVDVFFKENEISDEESVWFVTFERNLEMGVTGEGDAMRIFATVIDVLKDFTKKEKPQEIAFSADKPAWAVDAGKGQKGSREKLYKKMVQRYAGRMGYKYTSASSSTATEFRLVPK